MTNDNDKLIASEALYGFEGWLSSQSNGVDTTDCALMADLVNQFVKENKLGDPREGWHNNLIHPSGECSHGNDYEVSNSTVKMTDIDILIADDAGMVCAGKTVDAVKWVIEQKNMWKDISYGLYKILDDIDTASDHYKPEKSKYSHYVTEKVMEKGKYMWSDGYNVFPRDSFPVESTEKADPATEYFKDCAKIEKSYGQSDIWIDDLRAVPCKKSVIDLHQTTDADVWASEFCKTFQHLYKTDIDHEWVHSWMANAIMCGWDHQSWKRDKEYIYILKTRGGDILKVFHWEPSEKDVIEVYTDYYPEDITGNKYNIWDYVRLYRWSRSYGLTEMNGPKSESLYEWKATNQ